MLIKRHQQQSAQPVTAPGAEKVRLRVLFGPDDHAPNMAMRLFEVAPGGHTPHHEHPFEHEVFVVEGPITLVTRDGDVELHTGDAVMVPAGELHQFRNGQGPESARLLCMVTVENHR